MPEVPVVLGSYHVTLVPDEAMAHTCFDVGVIHEGEFTMLELVNYFGGFKCKRSFFFEITISYSNNYPIPAASADASRAAPGPPRGLESGSCSGSCWGCKEVNMLSLFKITNNYPNNYPFPEAWGGLPSASFPTPPARIYYNSPSFLDLTYMCPNRAVKHIEDVS